MSSQPKWRILVFAEGATLAHVARPLVLTQGLSEQGFDVCFARPPAFAWLTADRGLREFDLDCQSAEVFAHRLERGSPLYDLETLSRYVAADLALIQDTDPDVVVGDFRLSLAVSARVAKVPYAAICDAYWSPEAPLKPIVPVMPLTRFLPISAAQALFSAVTPFAFRYHARPMEALRRRYGLPTQGHDLRQAYTDADLRLFANPPVLFPEVQAHRGARFLGPVAWSPAIAAPTELAEDAELIYVTMGSSGNTAVLGAVFDALGQVGHPAVVASAGRAIPPTPRSAQIRVFDFLPGQEVAARSRLVICNGGSPTTNQALLAGVPILGIPTNMDQFLNMRAIEERGCGLTVRADRASPARLVEAIARVMDRRNGYARAAEVMGAEARSMDPGAEFARCLTKLAEGVRR